MEAKGTAMLSTSGWCIERVVCSLRADALRRTCPSALPVCAIVLCTVLYSKRYDTALVRLSLRRVEQTPAKDKANR